MSRSYRTYRTPAIIAGALTATALIGIALWPDSGATVVRASGLPDSITLTGVVRDFQLDHPDFNVVPDKGYGHYTGNAGLTLGTDGRPVLTNGGGYKVKKQWRDSAGRPIAPHLAVDADSSGEGLVGGHFDVDVFDELTDKELYHKHEFDDSFDVTYVDVVTDSNLLYDTVIGSGYPNDLRVEFFNPHHGSGTYVFNAGSLPQTGNTKDGFTTVFNPADLTEFRVTFQWLGDLRATSPGDVQSDFVDRDDAFSIRMYDTITNELVYELAAYHHGDELAGGPPFEPETIDSCGVPIADEMGEYDKNSTGGITSADTFDEWFRDVLGTNMSIAHSITLNRNGDVYEYLTDAFHPVDRDEYAAHNRFLTYAIVATFEYEACTGQFIEFEGDDDAWAFIDGTLAMDLGGMLAGTSQYVSLDRLGLVDGQTYQLNFFYAQRQVQEASFNLRTNVLLQSDQVTVSAGYD